MKTVLAGLLLTLLCGMAGAMTSRERCEMIARLELEQCREQEGSSTRSCGNIYTSKLRHCERSHPAPIKKPRKKAQEDVDGASSAAPTSIHSPAAGN